MTVLQTFIWQPSAGRDRDFVAAASTAKKIQERIGYTVRLWQNMIAGPNSGTYLYALVSKDLTTHFERSTALGLDSEWQTIMGEWMSSRDPIATMVSSQLGRTLPELESTDIPTNTSGMPRVLELMNFAPMNPAQREHFVAMAKEAKTLFARDGVGMRAVETQVAGGNFGAISSTMLFDSAIAYGKFGDKFESDEAWQSFMGRAMSGPNAIAITGISMMVEVLL